MKNKNYSFTRTMLSIAIPLTLQNLLFSSFMLIDTVMVGSLGDLPLAAVGMAGKWSWFLNIVLFGCTSGAAVFIAQYFGAGDHKGIHRTYGLMSILSLASALVFMACALLIPETVVGMFTKDPQAIEAATVYLRIIALSYPFQAMGKSASTLLQSTQRVVIPFVGAACSVVTNIVLNALLIFGLCGFPAMGVAGAALASAIAAVVNAVVIYGLALSRGTMLRAPLREMLDISRSFVRDYVRVGAPAMFNETIWALSILIYSAIFGHMSTEAYASITVVKSIEDLTCVAIHGMCSACAVMIGSYVGQGKYDHAKACARYHIAVTTALSVVIGGSLFFLKGPIMSLFGVSDVVRADSMAVMMIYGAEMAIRNIPLMLVVGTFRAGGDTKYGLIVDLISAYLIGIPVTAVAGLVLHASVPVTYAIMYCVEDILKVIVYGRHFLSDRWIKPVV
ncbi:MAG: MATE family efflux transporter [Clostridiales bacterium]|nr:MATE family efflux transporter [Clostridiales bacterium]